MKLSPRWTGALVYARALALVLSPCLGCDAPEVKLGKRSPLDAALNDASDTDAVRAPDADNVERADADDRDDESPSEGERPCADATQCTRDEPFCQLERGVCVECLRNADCTKPNERCESDGECDTPD